MRVIITGDRGWACHDLAERIVNRLVVRYGPDLTIVHGGATGVDQAFDEAATDAGVDVEAYPAQWSEIDHPRAIVRHDRNGVPYDAGAGSRRNEMMIARGVDLCLAVHRNLGGSRGTKDCVRQAIGVGITTYLIADETGEPIRLRADDPRVR